jgi:YcaO-like protein with predicted kinase domain
VQSFESRTERREALAKSVLRLEDETLEGFGIARVGQVTRLDTVGIPVWTVCRPQSRTTSISSGKHLESRLAKAAAIIEGIEFSVSENPTGPFWYGSAGGCEGRFMGLDQLPLVIDSLYRLETPVCWEQARHLNEGRNWWVPSDLIWMVPRVTHAFDAFQMSSNGLAAGYSEADSTLQALYEVIERDGWTLSEFGIEKVGAYPGRVNLSHAEGELQEALSKIKAAGLELNVFDCTREFGIPVMGATVREVSLSSPGVYGGYGCASDGTAAVLRAVLEAVQSRACYISAARDDMWRHQFLLTRKANDPAHEVRFLNALPETTSLQELPKTAFAGPDSELLSVLDRLKVHGVYDVWRKGLLAWNLPTGETLCVVRVFASGLELYRTEQWHPSKRAWKDAQRLLKR